MHASLQHATITAQPYISICTFIRNGLVAAVERCNQAVSRHRWLLAARMATTQHAASLSKALRKLLRRSQDGSIRVKKVHKLCS